MRGFKGIITVSYLASLMLLVSCSDKSRVIDSKKMTDIYVDLLIADQWLVKYPEYRTKADTTLFYDPIFAKHSVSYTDFNASVAYYVDHPEDFQKIMINVGKILTEKRDEYTAISEREEKIRRMLYESGYVKKDFSLKPPSDSLRWVFSDTISFSEWQDTTISYVERKDGFRPHIEPSSGKLVRNQPSTRARKNL